MVKLSCENRSGYKSPYFGGISTEKYANLSYRKRWKLQSTVNSVANSTDSVGRHVTFLTGPP